MVREVTQSAIDLNNSFGFTGMLLLIMIALSAVFFTYMFKYLERKDDRYEKQQDRWIAEFAALINTTRESNKEFSVALKENTEAIHKLSNTMEVGFTALGVMIKK